MLYKFGGKIISLQAKSAIIKYFGWTFGAYQVGYDDKNQKSILLFKSVFEVTGGKGPQ